MKNINQVNDKFVARICPIAEIKLPLSVTIGRLAGFSCASSRCYVVHPCCFLSGVSYELPPVMNGDFKIGSRLFSSFPGDHHLISKPSSKRNTFLDNGLRKKFKLIRR